MLNYINEFLKIIGKGNSNNGGRVANYNEDEIPRRFQKQITSTEIVNKIVSYKLVKTQRQSQVAHACNFSTLEAEAQISLKVLGQPRLRSELKAGLTYTMKPCLKQTKNGKEKRTEEKKKTPTGVYTQYLQQLT